MAAPGTFTAAVLTAAELNAIGTWTTWTPSWTNVTVGNGTVLARYTQLNKRVLIRLKFTLGSTSSVSGDMRFSVPVTAYDVEHIGSAFLNDTGTETVAGSVVLTSTTVAAIRSTKTGVLASTSATAPFTWANTDYVVAEIEYEAA